MEDVFFGWSYGPAFPWILAALYATVCLCMAILGICVVLWAAETLCKALTPSGGRRHRRAARSGRERPF